MSAEPNGRALEAARAPSESISVEAVDDAFAPRWDHFVDAHPDASAYHAYRWRALIRSVFGHGTHYLAASDGGGICGVLPLVRLKSVLFGDFLVSMPYFNYGGVLANHAAAQAALLDAAVDLARSLGVSHAELRHRATLGCEWPARNDKVTMLLRLPRDPDAFEKSLPSKLRSQAKRAAREGATYVFGGVELLDEFYAVFAENMRDLGTPVYGKQFFRAILQTFPRQATLALVRLANSPVAAGFLLRHRHTVEIPWASSLRRADKFAVNMHLYLHVLRHAIEHEANVFDFGRSTLDAGTYRFKKQWGAEPLQLYWHYWLASGGNLPRLNPDNPKFRLAVSAWQRLPLAAANWLGPRIVRNLP